MDTQEPLAEREPLLHLVVRHPLSRARRRAFLIATILTPAAFFLLLEATLRLFHYGTDLSLFVETAAGGKTFAVMNPEVGRRYFLRTRFHPATSPDVFLPAKPPGTFRIFCLGGSTTVGFPYWFNGAFPAFLRNRLQAVFPDRPIEVINLGLTATNSYTVLDFASELDGYAPDLLIVYDGHNEFYGALGAASREVSFGSGWIVRAYLSLLRFRTVQLLRDVYAFVAVRADGDQETDDRGTMMERLARGKYVPLDGPLYRSALRNFRTNLTSLRELCRDHQWPIIVSTQVSNVRTVQPFVSLERPGLTTAQRMDFNLYFNGAQAAWLEGKVDSALSAFHRALDIDSGRADVAYRIGQCCDSLHRLEEAREWYRRARDLDQLRFRASSGFNNEILAAADGATLTTVAMDHIFSEASSEFIVGNELILEHLHPTSRGAFTMARAFARAIRSRELIATEGEWARRDTVPDSLLWHCRPMSLLDDIIAARKIEILTSGWPFVPGIPTVRAVPAADTLRMIAEQFTRGSETWQGVHERALKHHAAKNDDRNVEREYRALISQSPLDIEWRLRLARLYLDRGRLDDMRSQLLSSLDIRETVLAYRALGDLALRRGNMPDAIKYYRNILRFPQSEDEMLQNGFLLSLAFFRDGRQDSAAAHARRLLTMKSDYAPALEMLRRVSEGP